MSDRDALIARLYDLDPWENLDECDSKPSRAFEQGADLMREMIIKILLERP